MPSKQFQGAFRCRNCHSLDVNLDRFRAQQARRRRKAQEAREREEFNAMAAPLAGFLKRYEEEEK
jgi:hypothetical protein